ncbi:MAG: ParB/RepB/Spo0J family partition protein [Campylobacterales bacterium]|nr:ParB/RepB/Spo0J family partition protein [Campylobacterales bacterium]
MALGRSLGAILEDVEEAYSKNIIELDSLTLAKNNAYIEEIDLSLISPNPYQPRKHFDEDALKELSDSILKHGLLQPIVVIKKDSGYILIAGERRFRAHKLANLTKIKSIVVEIDIDSVRIRELALIENIQRENLNPIELANSYNELLEVHKITHDELSSIVHKSRSQITNTLRLLSLIPEVQKELIGGKITQGHAKVLVGLTEDKQHIALLTIIGQKLSVRDAEQMVKNYKTKQKTNDYKSVKAPSFNIKKYTDQLKEILPFSYKTNLNKLEISFQNKDEFEKFINMIKKV